MKNSFIIFIMNKKVTIITAALVCAVLCAPFSLFGQSGDFEMDRALLVKYRGKEANLTLPANVATIGKEAFTDNKNLISITIPAGVNLIETGAFNGCSSLTSIIVDGKNRNYSSVQGVLFNKIKTVLVRYPAGKNGSYNIPDGVSSIAEYAFLFCSGLTGVNFPESLTTIERRIFEGCTSLAGITVDAKNKSYSSIEGVLFNKNNTVLIRYPVGKKEKDYIMPATVTTIRGEAFYKCTGLTSVTLPERVTTIGEGAFYECQDLANINIPRRVSSIGDAAFYKCPLPVEIRNDILERFGSVVFAER